MLNISFAWTTSAFKNRSKTETRRFWTPKYATMFKPGVLFMGISKDFRAGGIRLHKAEVVFCFKEKLLHMSEESFIREGGKQFWENRDEYITAMGGAERVPYVIRFQHLP